MTDMVGNQAEGVYPETDTLLLEALGNRVVELRKRQGWNRRALAARLGVTVARLAKWEIGAHAPPLGKLAGLAELFGVTLDDLVLGPGDGKGRGGER